MYRFFSSVPDGLTSVGAGLGRHTRSVKVKVLRTADGCAPSHPDLAQGHPMRGKLLGLGLLLLLFLALSEIQLTHTFQVDQT